MLQPKAPVLPLGCSPLLSAVESFQHFRPFTPLTFTLFATREALSPATLFIYSRFPPCSTFITGAKSHFARSFFSAEQLVLTIASSMELIPFCTSAFSPAAETTALPQGRVEVGWSKQRRKGAGYSIAFGLANLGKYSRNF